MFDRETDKDRFTKTVALDEGVWKVHEDEEIRRS